MQNQFQLSFLLMKVNGFPQEVNEDKSGYLGLKNTLFSWLSALNLFQLQQMNLFTKLDKCELS